MRRFRISGRRLHLLMALLFILTNFASPAALSANQDTPPEVGVLITSFSCINDPGNASLTAGTMPSDCAPVAGVVMSVTSDIDGEVSGTTGQNGAAEVTVSLGSTITVWQDQTLLSGTTPRMNPITVSVLDYTEVTFVSLPVATVAPEPTTAPEPTVAPTEVVEQPTAPVVEPPAPTADTTQQQDLTAQPSSRTMQTTQTEKPYQPDPNKDEPPTTEATETATSEATETATSEATETATTEVTQTPTSEATVTPTTPPTVTPTATTAPTQAPTPTPTKPPAPTPTPTPAPVTKTFATVSNTGGVGLRCRAEPNTSATIITVLPEGTKVETRGAASNSWIPVKCANQNGWIYAGYAKTSTETTSPTSPTTPPSGTTGTATVSNTGGAGLRCRASASTSAAIITVLPEGTKVETRGATSNGWIPVKCAGQNGYIYASYATVNTTANPTPTPAPTTPPVSGTAGWGTVKNTGGGGLNCRTSASLSASVITILAEGSTVETRGATSNGWVPVKCAGQDGWVYSSYFVVSTSGTAPKPTPTPAPSTGTGEYAMVSGTGYGGLNCRTSASLSASVIMILPEGTRVETRGSASNGWLPVKCAGQNGWVSTSYVLMGVGAGSGTGAVWIEVDLSRQYMRVYRGDTVIGETYVSTGRYGFDTPPGTFYINWKLPSQTMTGVLGGEYYYVEDVPWVMYFTDRGHAIHGAYWHNNFGYRMSHGCVNLPVGFSKWLYEISPVGTRVWIHY